MRSGKIAAEVIDEGLNGNSLRLHKYTQMVNDEVINDFRYARYLAIILYNLTTIMYNLGVKRELINERPF